MLKNPVEFQSYVDKAFLKVFVKKIFQKQEKPFKHEVPI